MNKNYSIPKTLIYFLLTFLDKAKHHKQPRKSIIEKQAVEKTCRTDNTRYASRGYNEASVLQKVSRSAISRMIGVNSRNERIRAQASATDERNTFKATV